MNFKYAFCILILFSLLISSVCADDDVTVNTGDLNEFDNDTQINYHGVNFTIPEGYRLLKNTSLEHDFWENAQCIWYMNNEGDMISITVISSWFGCNLDDLLMKGR